jgi:hypothetical protein
MRKKLIKKLSASKIINEIPKDILEKIGTDSRVDYQVKHLTGELMLKLIIYSLFKNNKISTRILEHYYNSSEFSFLTNKGKHRTKHSSIADRLRTISTIYFESLFEYFSLQIQNKYKGKTYGGLNLERFDSTMVAISAGLIDWGIRVGTPAKKKKETVQLKYSIGLRGLFPSGVKMYHDQVHISEDIALKEVIEESIYSKDSITVFDRGVQKRDTFDEFSEQGLYFVTRAKENVKYEEIKTHKTVKGRKAGSLILVKDIIVKLKKARGKPARSETRLIIAKDPDTNLNYYFLTNILDLPANQIAEIYKHRWDIEVFFRFIKQELNFDNIKPYNKNGILVMLYVTLITASMIILYKNQNKIEGYKSAKLLLIEEIEKEIIAELIRICGGNVKQYKQLYCT